MLKQTIKDKVEKIIVDYMQSLTCNSLYVPVKVIDKIDKLYQKEIAKEKREMIKEAKKLDEVLTIRGSRGTTILFKVKVKE